MTDLISEAVGGRVVSCNDEFFAEAANLLRTADPVWREGEYTDRGKWMDGWETRRRREPGHDWCVLALGIPGRVGSVTIDTSFFTGNYPEAFSLEACGTGSDRIGEDEWVELISHTDLAGDTRTMFEVVDPHRVSHLRLNIFPDGGVARIRVDGEPIPDMEHVCPGDRLTDLVSSVVGGAAIDASDSHYSPPSNMLRPTPPAGMWDGCETRRRRGPGHDWAEFRLGIRGVVESVVVDTRHFKGNAPGWVSIHLSDDGEVWDAVVTQMEVGAHRENTIELEQPMLAGYLRLDIHPDGGVARVRALGHPDPDAAAGRRVAYVDALVPADAERLFHTACASRRWVGSMVIARPFREVATVFDAANAAFDRLGEEDWLEAFAGHPRIGDRGDAIASREQAGVASASRQILDELAEVNREYERRHGFTYLVYATGKTAEEMLALARGRLGNDTAQEISIASREQRAITKTRLEKMLCLRGPS